MTTDADKRAEKRAALVLLGFFGLVIIYQFILSPILNVLDVLEDGVVRVEHKYQLDWICKYDNAWRVHYPTFDYRVEQQCPDRLSVCYATVLAVNLSTPRELIWDDGNNFGRNKKVWLEVTDPELNTSLRNNTFVLDNEECGLWRTEIVEVSERWCESYCYYESGGWETCHATLHTRNIQRNVFYHEATDMIFTRDTPLPLESVDEEWEKKTVSGEVVETRFLDVDWTEEWCK